MAKDLRDEILGLRSGDSPERLIEGIAQVVTEAGVPVFRPAPPCT